MPGKRSNRPDKTRALAVAVSSLVFAAALPRAPLYGQGWNASLEGMVLDSSQAAIPGASVRLSSSATGQIRKTETDDTGFYSFPFLPVGTYELEVSKPGFAGKTERGLVLEVGQAARQDITLEVAREQVQVQVEEGQTPLVETASPARGEEFNNRRVSLLPLNGRQFSQLALLAAGAVPPYPNSATQQFNTAAQGLGFSVNGQRSERNNFTLDGVTIMEPFAYSITVNPSLDAIREFRVVENSYSAALGLTSGAQVQIATRAGTNRFSGTVYEYLRNSALDAKNFFDDPSRPIPPFRQNQFGASFGGPLRRDRTFFFANYEGYRIRQSVTNTTLLPTAAERAGDFSGIDPASQIGKPFPTIIDANGCLPGRAPGQPFPGNQVPVSCFDPLSAAVLERVPLPNRPNVPSGQNNNLNVGQHPLTSDQFTVRLDHELTSRNELFARFTYFDSAQLFPYVPNVFAQNPSAPPGFGTNKDDTGRNLALGLTSILRPTLINDFRFGYEYYFGTKEGQNIHDGFLQTLGIARAPGSINKGITAINVPGYADLGDSDIFQPQIRKNNTFQFTDNLAWVKGRHTFQFGADVHRLQLFYLVENFGQGFFSFSDGASSVSGTAFTDFLLGRPFLSFAQAGNSGGNDRVNYLGTYFSDQFHATRRLTLTYGLREEFYSPPINVDGRGAIVDPSNATQFIVQNDRGQARSLVSNPLVQQLQQQFDLHFITSQQAGLPSSLTRPDWSGWAPRFGFAYDLTGDGRTSLRGGAGVFNALGELDYTAETRLSAPISESLFGLDLCRFYGPGACGQSYAPPILTYTLGYQLGNTPPSGVSTPPNIRNGYVYEWSISLQRELTPNTLLSVSYVGSEGHKLPRRALQNQGVPNVPPVDGESGRRGYHPQPGSNYFVRSTDVNSNYNGLVMGLERRFARGLAFTAGYTWGKSIDTASGLQGTNQPQDNYNMKAERGLSDFDVRQRFVLSGTWVLPFGAGRRWLNDGLGAKAFGGWQLAGIATLQSGQPITALLSTALSGTQSNGTDRPDLTANPNLPAGQRDPNRWFNAKAFCTPVACQPTPPIFQDTLGAYSIPGNEGRNVITGPGLAVWDASLRRQLRLSERASLTFSADFFNLTNHPNFDRPGLIVGTSNFGLISSAENSRQIQFALRISW